MNRTRRIAIAFLIFPLSWAAEACAPGTAAPGVEIRQRLTFSGDAAPQIEILRGSPGWMENTKLTFSGARWDFFPNGTFRFTPGAAVEVRDDLYPFSGTYKALGDRLELHATRRSDLGASVSFAGYLWGLPDQPRIVAMEGSTWVGNPKIIKIQQTLVDLPKKAPEKWPPVPAKFSVTVRGQMEEEPFGPLAGTLTLSPSREGDPNPLSLALQTSELDRPGSLSWISFLSTAEPRVQFNSVTLRPAEKEIVAQMLPGVKNLLAPNWVRWVQPPQGLSELGPIADWVQAEEGRIRLRLNGNHLSGDISAWGQGQQPGRIQYEAKIEGELRGDEGIEISSPTPTNPYAGEVLFGGLWHSDQRGEIRLNQTGAVVKGSLEGGTTSIEGQADGSILSFHWKDKDRGEGTGLLIAFSDRQLLAGLLLDEETGQLRTEIAERRVAFSGAVVPPASREDLKYRGYDLVMEGRCLEAIEPLEQARALYQHDRDRAEIWDLMRDGYLIDEVNILTRLSACYAKLKRFDSLLENLRNAIPIYERLAARRYDPDPTVLADPLESYRRQLTSDLDKIQVQDESRIFFEELTNLLLKLNQPTEALVASEKARARAFAELMAVDEPRRSLPGGQVLRAGTTLPVTAETLKAAVRRSRSTVVEYMLTEQRLIVWVVPPEGEVQVEFVPVSRQVLKERIRELLALLGSGYKGDQAGRRGTKPLAVSVLPEEQRSRILHRLHDDLIAPIAKHLPPQEGARVTFVPDGLLFLVPFPALLDARNQPLLTRFTPMTAPAIGALASLHAPSTARWVAPEVLVVGDPSLPPGYAHLDRLPHANDEALEVAKIFGASSLLDSVATRERIVAAMPGARLIHFASHGLLEHGDEKDAPGALVLASSGQDDGLLTAREIAGLRLRADLVVLSACDSGSGRLTGDGVVGLSRSFLAAGANGVVVSLWQVDDRSTALLMKEFYRRLKLDGGRAHALREAMIETRKTFPDPRQWAAFTFIGVEPEAQEASKIPSPSGMHGRN